MLGKNVPSMGAHRASALSRVRPSGYGVLWCASATVVSASSAGVGSAASDNGSLSNAGDVSMSVGLAPHVSETATAVYEGCGCDARVSIPR